MGPVSFDPLAILLFLLFLLVPLARRLLEPGRDGTPPPRRAPGGPVPGGPVAFPAGRPFPAPPPPAPPAEAAGEGVGMEGPAPAGVEDVGAEADAIARRGETLGSAVAEEARRLAEEADREERLQPRLGTELAVAPDVAPAAAPRAGALLPDDPAALARAMALVEVLGPPRARRPMSLYWRRSRVRAGSPEQPQTDV